MRDEQTNTQEPMTCTWVAVTGSDGRAHMEARWLPATAPVVADPVAAHAA